MVEIPLEQLLDYRGNRYKIARACMEYVKCIRYLNTEDANSDQAKEVLVAIKHILSNDIKHTSDKFEIEIHQDEVEFLKTFKTLSQSEKSDPTATDQDATTLSAPSALSAKKKANFTPPEQDELYNIKPLDTQEGTVLKPPVPIEDGSKLEMSASSSDDDAHDDDPLKLEPPAIIEDDLPSESSENDTHDDDDPLELDPPAIIEDGPPSELSEPDAHDDDDPLELDPPAIIEDGPPSESSENDAHDDDNPLELDPPARIKNDSKTDIPAP